MKENIKNAITVLFIGAVWFSLAFYCWVNPSQDISISERRKLEQLPELSILNITSGEFMKDFEQYTQDQFPNRFLFRSIKAFTRFYVFYQNDNNNIYIEDGYAAKLEYPLKENSIINASEKFRYLYEKYMKDKDVNIYLSIIPDKGYFLAGKNGYPSLDYDKMFDLMKHNMEFAEYINISDILELNDYYKTDIHWRQEKIFKVAEKIGAAMGISEELSGSYTMIKTDIPFYGVYYGQSALPIGHDKIYYLTNETIDNCSVYNIETKNTTSIYDIEKLNSYDPYGVYLSGASPLLIIENPNVKTDKELIVFRDSFGSSLIPLLMEGYSKVTLVDIRYITSDYLEKFITFNNQDVIFLYSTLILNSSEMLK